MSIAIVSSRAPVGISAPAVQVEAHISNGLPSVQIVGLPEAAVRESRDRVRSALINSGWEFPARRITLNLAPADLPKEGGRFDLPIALAILCASGQIPQQVLNGVDFLGELALTGELRPVSAVLPAAVAARTDNHALVLPQPNATEASRVADARVHGIASLHELCQLLVQMELPPATTASEFATPAESLLPDLTDVRGQQHARRALEIAATGQHNLLLFGPPGAGKTLLAERLPGILPPLDESAALQTACLYSVAGISRNAADWNTPPYRAPHHTASHVAIAGGGSMPRPGEVSLAHNGVLFLDELPEFQRAALEVLREPLECGEMRISRARQQCAFPARFQLIAAMNPCPCGYGANSRQCRCSAPQIQRYLSRLSGPLLDRIDLHVQVDPVPVSDLLRPGQDGESSIEVSARVRAGREVLGGDGQEEEPIHRLQEADREWVASVATHRQLSGRALHRMLRVARTIAALAGSRQIERPHLLEAFSYRSPLAAEPARAETILPSTPTARTSPECL